jgi:hypothetical protein
VTIGLLFAAFSGFAAADGMTLMVKIKTSIKKSTNPLFLLRFICLPPFGLELQNHAPGTLLVPVKSSFGGAATMASFQML